MAASHSVLERMLTQLHEWADGKGSIQQVAQQLQAQASDVSGYCLQFTRSKDLAFCSSLVFNEKIGVVSFLQSVANRNELTHCKETLLKFLTAFVPKLGQRVQPYVVEIKNVCSSLFIKDQSARVRNATFGPLIEIFQCLNQFSQDTRKQLAHDLGINALIKRFMDALLGSVSKYPATVRMNMMHMLGLIAEMFPLQVTGKDGTLLQIYMANLKAQMENSQNKKTELTIIAGALKGLTCFLKHFTQAFDDGVSEHSRAYDIYKYTMMAMNPKVELNRYEVPRSALWLMAHHAGQYRKLLASNYDNVYNAIVVNCRHKNKDLQKAGFRALEAFLKEISAYIVENGKQDKLAKSMFKFLFGRFHDIINTETSSSREVSISIRGFGYLAGPCKLLMKEADLKVMFHDLAKRADQINLTSASETDEAASHLSSYIDAISGIIHELDDVSDFFLSVLERLVILLFEVFPRLHPGQRKSAYIALTRCFLALYPRGDVLKSFYGKVVYQGLLRVCSQPPAASLDGDDSADAHSDYIELFENMLSETYLRNQVSVADLPEENRADLFALLYDELVRALLRIVDRLNFTTRASDTADADDLPTGDATSDPVAHITAAVPKDFQIFITFVEFCQELLPRVWPSLFLRWVPFFVRKLVTLSSKHPFVSGFYKLLQTAMTISRKASYFQGVRDSSERTLTAASQGDGTMDTDAMDPEPSTLEAAAAAAGQTTKSDCFHFVMKFVKEVLVRMKQFKDELLASTIRFVLSLPHEFVERDVGLVLPALTESLKLGLGFPALASTAADALEYWAESVPSHLMAQHFKSLLPHLDAYFSAAHRQVGTAADEELQSMAKALQSKRSKARGSSPDEALTLESVRIRLVKVVGQMGGQTAGSLALATVEDQEECPSWMAWDRKKHLKFAIPFRDIKPTIYLDDILPRVCELATKSSDRQIKVAACELLHSLVIFMIGQSAQQPGGAKAASVPLHALYKRVLPAILQLAADVDVVAQQLYKPLVFQMIHWFTKSKKYESDEVTAFLGAVLDGLCDPTDCGLRDFCGKCVGEFFAWSIKHQSPEQLKRDPANVKSLLKRVYSLAEHPNAFNRLGAALAVNNIYRTFREHDTLVDRFALELLHTMMLSLRFAHSDEKALGAEEQCSKAIQNLQRIVTKRAKLLTTMSKVRRAPSAWQGEATVVGLVTWTFGQVGRVETEVRHRAMLLFCSLAPHIPGVRSAAVWLHNKVSSADGRAEVIALFEGQSKRRRPADAQCSRVRALAWFESLAAMLECYNWAFGQGLADPAVLWAAPTDFPALVAHFVAVFGGTGPGALTAADTPREVDAYNRQKCTVIVRIFETLQVCLGRKPALALGPLWGPEAMELVVECVLRPQLVGFDPTDAEIARNLPALLAGLLDALAQRLPAKDRATLDQHMARRLTEEGLDLLRCAGTILDPDFDAVAMHNLVAGYEHLLGSGFLEAALPGGKKGQERLSGKLIVLLFDGCSQAQQTPTVVEAARRLMELALALHVPRQRLLDCLTDATELGVAFQDGDMDDSQDAQGKYVTQLVRGAAFLRDFGRQIAAYCLRHFTFFGPVLMKGAAHRVLGRVLGKVLDLSRTDRSLRRYKPELLKGFLTSFQHLNAWWTGPEVTLESQVAAMALVHKFLAADHDQAKLYADPHFPRLLQMVTEFYSSGNIPLDQKDHALQVLPQLTGVPGNARPQLMTALEKLQKGNFPVRSSEYAEGSAKRREYLAALDHLLEAMVASGSLDILGLITTVFCREKEAHVHERQMQAMLARFIVAPKTAALDALTQCFKLFASGSMTIAFRAAIIERILCPCLRAATQPVVLQFFSAQVRAITSIVTERLRPSSAPDASEQLIAKTCACELMGLMYSRLSVGHVSSPGAQINKAYCGDEKAPSERGNDLTKAMCGDQGLRGAVTKTYLTPADDPTTPLRRRFHCSAYNALAALISCTQDKEKFYTSFLFKENPTKAERLLDNLVDLHRDFEFEAELSKPVEVRTTRIRGLRSELAGQAMAPGYMPSQYLLGSSLSQDVSGMDVDDDVPDPDADTDRDMPDAAAAETPTGAAAPAAPMDLLAVPEQVPDQQMYMISDGDLEMDDFNRHECMVTFLGLIDKLTQQIDPLPKVPEGEGAAIRLSREEQPPWMRLLHRKMSAGETHPNVRLFIAKLIVNRPSVFQHWATEWLTPLMQLMLWFDKGSKGFNYFVTDLCVVLLTWSPTAIPSGKTEIKLAQRLLHFLMANTRHENNAILRNNINIVKMFMEKWGRAFARNVPYFVIYSNFDGHDRNSKWTLPGIHLLSVVLANDFAPFGPDAEAQGVDRHRYFEALINNLSFKSVSVYRAAAYVLGMALHALGAKDDIDDGIKDLINAQLRGMVKPNPQQDRFLTCLHNMCNRETGFPPLADPFLQTLLFWLPGLNGVFKTMAIEVLQWRCATIDTMAELRAKNLLGLLRHRDSETQLVVLRTLKELAPGMAWEHVVHVLPTICRTFSDHKEVACRAVYYDILCTLYDRKARMAAGEEGGEEIDLEGVFSEVRVALLRGLMDEAASVRETLFRFWDHETRLDKDTVERLLQTLTTLYAPATEPYFLQYASNLLLRLTTLSVDFDRPLFEHPLSECTYQQYDISSSWHQRNAHMTPLFAATQMSQSGVPGLDDDDGDYLMATQGSGAQFTLTQTGLGPLSQLGLGSASSASASAVSQTLSHTQQVLLFRRKRRRRLADSQAAADGSAGAAGSAAGSGAASASQAERDEGRAAAAAAASQAMEAREIRHLRRRFVRTKESQSSTQQFWKRQALARRKRLRQAQHTQKKARENQIVMFRHYRTGELPDVQIKQRDLLEPLQGLALRDATLAGQFYRALFEAVYVEVESTPMARAGGDVRRAIGDGLRRVLETTGSTFSPFVGALQAIGTALSCVTVDATAVGLASLASGSLHSGISLVEEQIMSRLESVRPAKRRRGAGRTTAGQSPEFIAWIELARLYKAIGEFDVVHGVFAQRIGAKAATLEALEHESRGDYKRAIQLYTDAIVRPSEEWEDGTINLAEADMWEDARSVCLQRLCNWRELEELTLFMVDETGEAPYADIDQDGIWREPRWVEHHLGPLLESQLSLLAKGIQRADPPKDYGNALAEFVQRAMKVDERRAVLETRHGHLLAKLYFALGDLDRARYYVAEGLDRFLHDWSSVHPLMTEGRRAALRRLQPLAELDEFLGLLADDRSFQSLDAARHVLGKWAQRYPASLADPMDVWEGVVTTRMLMIARLTKECNRRWSDTKTATAAAIARLGDRDGGGAASGAEEEGEEGKEAGVGFKVRLTRAVTLFTADMMLDVAREAIAQGIFSASSETIRYTSSLALTALRTHDRLGVEIRMQHTAGLHRLGLSRSLAAGGERASTLLKGVGKLLALEGHDYAGVFERRPELRQAHSTIKAQTLLELALVLDDADTAAMLTDHDLATVSGALDVSNPAKLAARCCRAGFEELRAAVALGDPGDTLPRGWLKVPSKSRPGKFSYVNKATGQRFAQLPPVMDAAQHAHSEGRVELLLTLAQFCEDGLFGGLATIAPQSVDAGSLPQVFVATVLEAMRFGSFAAQQKLPKLLQLLEQHPRLIDGFLERTAVVPSWMFLGWISQMTALLDKPHAAAVHGILYNLIQAYPQAVRFPMMISSEGLSFDTGKIGQANQKAVAKFQTRLKSPLLDRMMTELEGLTNPEHVVSDWAKGEIAPLLSERPRNKAKIQASFDALKASVLDNGRGSRLSAWRQRFAKVCADKLLKLLGRNGEHLMTMDARTFSKSWRQILGAWTQKRPSEPTLLKDYSRWLDEFQGSEHAEKIEIPGQYTGRGKPQTEYHALIENFGPRLLVLASMRRPKRLQFRGNDEKIYPFLIKGGEDLRMDQRVQHLFRIMNDVMASDALCSQRRLRLRTYEVVPMTTRIGIIEWMRDTQPLKEVLKTAMAPDELKRYTTKDPKVNPSYAHIAWVEKFGKKFPQEAYLRMIQNAKRTDVLKEFERKQGMIPTQLLRDALMSFSASPEAFLTTRCHFGRTTATLSICNYLVGIGDRHLSNFMVDVKTGGLIGIDFGHAFGSATQFLGIPEMIPFRLTRQIVNVFLPHSEDGILKATMVHVLRAMQGKKDLLMSTMDVFVKEPLLDWQIFAKQQTKELSLQDDDLDADWYPQEKLAFARRKLEGHHPSHILADELELGHKRKAACSHMVQAVRGDKALNKRAKIGAVCRTVEEQVTCLIDQATDPNILGRTWGGWEPWV